VDPLGEALGPRVLPDGLMVLLGAVTEPVVVELPALPVVVPFIVEPVAVPLAAEPPPPPPPPPCLHRSTRFVQVRMCWIARRLWQMQSW
jgi:hypothetical protein